MAELDLRLSPRQHQGALECRLLGMAVNEVERLIAAGRHKSPKGDAHLPPARHTQPPPEREDGIEHRACGI